MGHSRAEKAKSRERILDAASRIVREQGLGALAIADLMKTAGLTHGAFYSHFSSRAELIAEAVAHALHDGEMEFSTSPGRPMADKAQRYLSAAHRDAPGRGCAVGALAMDAARVPEVKDRLAQRLDVYVSRASNEFGGGPEAEGRAFAIWSLMVGGITLARLYDGERSDQVLKSALDAAEKLLGPEAV